MVQNPNWPLIDYAVSWQAGPSQSNVQPYWCSVAGRTESKFHFKRGKQYELDEVEAGEADIVLRNDDGVFDPTNTASPYWPYVVPYRLFRARAQWPATQNLLTASQATAGYVAGTPYETGLGAGANTSVLPENVTPFGGSVVTSNYASAISSRFYAVTCGAGSTFQGVQIGGWSVTAGATYSVSAKANAAATGITGYLAVQWFDVNGVLVGAVNGTQVALTATAVTLTAVGAAPAKAVGAIVIFLSNGTPAGAANQINGWNFQVEIAAAPTTYTQPGLWYPMFTGYIERWPQSWTSAGNYGVVSLDIVDLFAWLSQQPLQQPFIADLLALEPNFLYVLDEDAGTSAFADRTNQRGTAVVSKNDLGNTIQPGASLTAQDNVPVTNPNNYALTGAFLGASGPVVHSDLPNGSTSSHPYNRGGALSIPPDPNTGLYGPPIYAPWTRIIALRATSQPPLQGFAWASGQVGVLTNLVSLFLDPATGLIYANIGNPVNSAEAPIAVLGNGTAITDADWHLYMITAEADGMTMGYSADGFGVGTAGGTAPILPTERDAAWYDTVGTIVAAAGVSTNNNWLGDIALVCELPFAMDATTWARLAISWRNAWGTSPIHTETSNGRYGRLLDWAGWTGGRRISTGQSTSIGPATDVDGNTNVLALLQNVVNTEGGQHFVAADGAITFQDRTARYNTTSSVTFGEHTGSGEIPYGSVQFDFDPTRVGNDAQVTAQYGSALYRTTDGNSQDLYGVIPITRTVNSTNPNELAAASQSLLYQNQVTQERLETLPVDVGKLSGSIGSVLWPAILGLDLGDTATVNRRPSNAPAKQLVGFIEQIEATIDDQAQAQWSLQLSNAARHNFWQMDSATYSVMDSTTILSY